MRNRGKPHEMVSTPRLYDSAAPDLAEHAARRARRHRRTVLWLACLAAASIVWIALCWSPAARTRSVVVKGVAALAPDELESTLRAVRSSQAQSFLAYPQAEVRQRLLALPWVREARLRWWPPFSISINITARQQRAQLRAASLVWQVDSEGTVIRAGSPREDMPMVVTERVSRIAPGRRIEDAATLEALRLAVTYAPATMPALTKIVVDPAGDLCLNIADGMVIRAGPPDRLPEKLAVVERIYRADRNTAAKVEEIDVRYLPAPFCKPKVRNSIASSQNTAASRSDERSRFSSSAHSGRTARPEDSAQTAVR